MNVQTKNKYGFTLVELLAALTAAMVLIIIIGTVMGDSWRTFYDTRDRVYSPLHEDALVVRRLYESTIRKCSGSNLVVTDSSQKISGTYYSSNSATSLDQYCYFYLDGDLLKAEYGSIDESSNFITDEVRTVCENVQSCLFGVSGQTAYMRLVLDDGQDSCTVISAATANN